MTSETTQPPVEMGPVPANGQGQSQGHRRRRRRRKNKSNQQGGMQEQGQNTAQPQGQGAAQPQGGGQAFEPGHGQGRKKKKKKKFFREDRGPAPQPGNSIHPPPQSRRKDRQKGPRTFVGPMDHSYRAVNGNVADSPPSTIPQAGNGHYFPELYHSGPAAAVREGTPTRIFCFIEDLFFQAKIQETSKKLGVKVEFVKNDKEILARLTEAPENERPTLVVFDLNNANAKPLILIPKLKAKLKKATSIVGFLSHLQGDLKAKAAEAGCDTVMPRSAFSQGLPNLLRRYGLDEEDENMPQPM
ncbi:MAG TPA: response regulator [Terracidiphilus sp.]|nr:response regulator [Terracidiphilus sp.]